jgi:hypothetical protein
MSRRRSNRRGYALMLVIVFVVLFTAVLGVAWRRVASALRIEHVSDVRKQCDKGSIQALAQAMRVLETRLHCDNSGVAWLDVSETSTPDYESTYTCKTSYNVSNDSTAPDYHWFTVAFTRDPSDGTWWVNVTVAQPNDSLSGLPTLPSSPP